MAQPEGEMGEIPLPYPIMAPFSILTTNYCNISLSAYNENKHFTCFRGSVPGLQGVGLRRPIPISDVQEGPFKAGEGLLESKLDEILVFIF